MKLSVDVLVQEFENNTLNPEVFGHTEHLVAAYFMLQKYPFIEAAATYSKCVKSLAKRAGAADKFNTTTTLAFLSLIAERMNCCADAGWDTFIGQNQDLTEKTVLSALYSNERLNSHLARKVFLLPDLPNQPIAAQ